MAKVGFTNWGLVTPPWYSPDLNTTEYKLYISTHKKKLDKTPISEAYLRLYICVSYCSSMGLTKGSKGTLIGID